MTYQVYTQPDLPKASVGSRIGKLATVFILLFFGAVIGFYAGVKTCEAMTSSMIESSSRFEGSEI